MKKHYPSDEMRKGLDNLLSKINALEVSAPDEFQRGIVKALRILIEGQIHSVNEFEHIKKAIDLVTLEFFDIKNKTKS